MEALFQYINTVPIPIWLAMMIAPRHPWTQRLARSSLLFILVGLHYVVALVVAVLIGQGSGMQGGGFTSLAGVNALLASEQGTLAAWAHMLALDLFAGAWIFREAHRLNAPWWVRVPCLFATLMAGPSGVVLFLLWRWLAARQGEELPHGA